MEAKYSFNGLVFKFPVRQAFAACAKEIEDKFKDIEKLHFSVHNKNSGYVIDLRVTSKFEDIISSIETNNINEGLKILKSATVNRLREGKKKIIHRSRKGRHERQLNLFNNDFHYKEAL